MNFHEYLFRVYTQKNIQNQIDKSFRVDAETKAIHALLDWCRAFYKFLGYFTVTYAWLKANTSSTYPPSEEAQIKAFQDAAAKKKEETKRKLEVVTDDKPKETQGSQGGVVSQAQTNGLY